MPQWKTKEGGRTSFYVQQKGKKKEGCSELKSKKRLLYEREKTDLSLKEIRDCNMEEGKETSLPLYEKTRASLKQAFRLQIGNQKRKKEKGFFPRRRMKRRGKGRRLFLIFHGEMNRATEGPEKRAAAHDKNPDREEGIGVILLRRRKKKRKKATSTLGKSFRRNVERGRKRTLDGREGRIVKREEGRKCPRNLKSSLCCYRAERIAGKQRGHTLAGTGKGKRIYTCVSIGSHLQQGNPPCS